MVDLANGNNSLNDQNKITYVSTLLTKTAAIWWYTLLRSQKSPTTWDEFTKAIRKEFVPEDHERRARAKLRACKQNGTVAKYLSGFRNIVLTIPDISGGEKWDKFVSGLKPKLQFEVRKSNCFDFDEATKIAMRVEAAFSGTAIDEQVLEGDQEASGHDAMEIGNAEGSYKGKDKQRLLEIKNNACFTCHKRGCRPWKHRRNSSTTTRGSVTNLEDNDVESIFDHVDSDSSEN